MEITKENMTLMEMLEKIAELDYGQSQLKELNTTMRHWLDVADDEMATLRSENVALRKQVKVLEQLISQAHEVEAEPCRFLLTDDLVVKRCSEKQIQKMEEESTKMKEENKKLNTELKNLQQEREQDMNSLSKFKAALKTIEIEMEEANVRLQQRDENLHQKHLELKHLKETVEEFSIIIKDLRQTNQELREQWEDRQDEALLSALGDLTEETDGSPSPPLSFFEEIKLLSSLDEVKTSTTDSTHLRHKETDTEDLMNHHSLTEDLQTKKEFRRTGSLQTAVQRAGLLLMCIFFLLVLVCVTSASISGNSDLFPINTFWTGARMILPPYCSVRYAGAPPV
ncbi:ERC protein 2-like [Platichthys flesus]|uniref:ERC protein 2-like n=1 Tax=Platichthys flesus TaxID=8260 RepID=UPI002DBAB5DA|nr:ERC protein 2-like [Platichthys flesus]